MDKKVFDAYSQYYDLLYKDKNYVSETEYIISLIHHFNKHTKTILELGCGTGIHASLLAQKGFYVDGIDVSETMLKMAIKKQSEAPTKVSERLSFLEADIRTYESSKKFDTIISLFHVMSYMVSNEDLSRAFATAKKQLNHDGIFIFDCWHGPGVLKDPPVKRTKTFEDDTILILRNATPTHFLPENYVDVNFEINIENKNTKHKIKLHEIHSMRYLFLEELNSIANINGLEIIHAEEWLTRKKLSDDSWNASYVCRNKN